MKDFQCATKEFTFKRDLFKVSDKESSITLSMYLGVKWEDSRIRNMNQTVEDLQVMVVVVMVLLVVVRLLPLFGGGVVCVAAVGVGMLKLR